MSWIDEFEARVRSSSRDAKHSTPLTLAQSVDPGYRSRPHLDYLDSRLVQAVQDVERGQNRFITVSMPPRMGKSQSASVWFPAWLLHRYPKKKLGLISHSPSLAASWGRQVRRVAERNPDLGIRVAPDAGAVTEWQTVEEGSVVSRSVGQSVTGLGFNVLMLDDIVRDFAAAHSESNRQSVWEWWVANVITRLEAPYLVIAIGTRWHEDDFIGRLLSPDHEGNPEDWERIELPAIAEKGDLLGRQPGEPLYSPILDETEEEALARWADIKSSVGSYTWAALYQQRPEPAKGTIFNLDWWRFYDEDDLPDRFDRVLTSWDCAFKGTSTSDYVVGQKWGVVGADRYLLDQVRGKWSFTETIRQMEVFTEGVTEHLVEDKANGPAVIDVLKRKIPGMIPVNPTNSKEARARAVTPQIESGNVYLPRPRPGSWVNDLLSESKSFPSGTHDDQVDALTQFLSRVSTESGVVSVSTLARNRRLGGW